MSSVNSYSQMWSELGLDLQKHEMLLSVLGKAYQDIFLSQKNRPEGMKYFDFVMSEVHGLRIKELLDAKKDGRLVIGSFCLYVPEELILAIDGISVGLCAGAEFGTEAAEQYLPRNTCALIKSFFGFTLERVCPYIAASDLIVGENTCDGKKKAYEIFSELSGKMYVMDIPQMKSPVGFDLLKIEYGKFLEKLEAISGKKVTVESLRKSIHIVNQKRKALHRLSVLRSADPCPISGLDALLINQIFFYDDPVRFTNSVNALCDELEERVNKGTGISGKAAARILITGCPMAIPNWKIPFIVEQAGAVIVAEESCVGERGTRNLTEEKAQSTDQMLNCLVDRYLGIDCAIFTPNNSREQHVIEMSNKYKAHGVIQYNLQFCNPYQIESIGMEKNLEKQGIPVLRIDTDYSQQDIEQIRTRIEAFIERIER